MAEQEACVDLVDRAASDHTPDKSTIEGESIIPLLQGLLQAPENDITPDSGTESSGEEKSGLIAEVQAALDKLAASLKNDPTEISAERRCSLLQLVAKLQAGLATTGKERRASSSSQSRFQKRRNRQNRHTVGVSTEELADARRLIEEISLNELIPSSSKVTLQKQNSESSVSKVKNSIPKPFSSSSISNASSSVQTPTENLNFLFGENQEVTFHDPAPVQQKSTANYATTSSGSSNRVSQSNSADSIDSVSIKSVHQAIKEAAANKILEQPVEDSNSEEEAEVEEQTMKEPQVESAKETLQVNPIYKESSVSPTHEEKVSRFNTQSKKLKMKRANTIDIPKNLILYDEDSSDNEENDTAQRRNNYYALRGPIRVNTPQVKNTVPVFQPKTDSDKKFVAFINKHNENPSNKPSAFTNNNSIWGNKFGNIKNTFEKATNTNNSARSFWKSADDAISAGSKTQFGPKISRQSARNLQQMFEDKKKESNQTGVVTGSLKIQSEPRHIFKPTPQPLPVNKFSHAPQSAFKPVAKKIESHNSAPATPEITKYQIKNDNEQVFLYAPKPMFSPPATSTTKPWAVSAAEKGSRVLGLAAAKFEQPPPQQNVIKPRKMSKEANKVFIPQERPPEVKPTAPYINRSVENKQNTVRKLSGQYDHLQQDPKPQFRPEFTQVQNYSIRYDLPRSVQQKYPPQGTPYQNYPRITPQSPQNYSISYQSPQTYSIRYDQPQNNVEAPPKPAEYTAESAVCYRQNPGYISPATQPQQFQPQPESKQEDVQYKSTFDFKPQSKVPIQTIEPVVQHSPKLETQTSTESVHEYLAVSSKVMKGPETQTAVTVKQKSPMSREGHDMEAALKSTLQKVNMFENNSKSPSSSFKSGGISSPNNSFKYKNPEIKSSLTSNDSFKYKPSDCPKPTVSPSTFKFKPTVEEKRETGVVKPMLQRNQPIYNNVGNRPRQSLEVNSRGESVVTSQFQIPVINIKSPTTPSTLNRADTWHQVCASKQQTNPKPVPPNKVVVRSKSSHSLAVPKLFEAGMSRDEIDTKRKTIEAYLNKSPPEVKMVKSSVKRIKTSEKISAVRQNSGGISRSRTLPDIVCPALLDESNIDKAFDDLFKSS